MAMGVRGPGSESVSIARLSLYSTIGAAIIGAATTLGVGIMNQGGGSIARPDPPPVEPAAVTITPTTRQTSDSSSAFRFVVGDTGEVTVSGSSKPDVAGIYVLIGPRPSGGYWGAYTSVSDEQWQAVVSTEPPWEGFPITVQPVVERHGAAAKPANFSVQATDTTTPQRPPDEILRCAELHGPSCFNGPQFGQPSVYG